jgi:hypothetical protein
LRHLLLPATQGIFWAFTYPVNRQTNNWANASTDWPQLRDRWKYSHTCGAGLDFVALRALVLPILISI